MRIAAGIQYRGTAYSGFQEQSPHPQPLSCKRGRGVSQEIPSIQAALEKAFSKVANHPLKIICAGRTDKGVHATGQVIHFDTDIDRTEHAWLCGANLYLPRDIAVVWIKKTSNDFHARFSALSRTYRYTIYNSAIRPVLDAEIVTWHFAELNLILMQLAAQHLIGEHDFTSFRGSGCQSKSPRRCIESISIAQQGQYIILEITANAFLYHMVRNIVGVLLKIGEGKASTDWPLELLAVCDRKQAAKTAPASGLTLISVSYPEAFFVFQKSCPPKSKSL